MLGPDNSITQALIEELGQPLMSTSLIMPGDETPLSDPYEIRQMLEHTLDLVVDGGYCGMEATTVVNMTDDEYEIIRQGVGELAEL